MISFLEPDLFCSCTNSLKSFRRREKLFHLFKLFLGFPAISCVTTANFSGSFKNFLIILKVSTTKTILRRYSFNSLERKFYCFLPIVCHLMITNIRKQVHDTLTQRNDTLIFQCFDLVLHKAHKGNIPLNLLHNDCPYRCFSL